MISMPTIEPVAASQPHYVSEVLNSPRLRQVFEEMVQDLLGRVVVGKCAGATQGADPRP